MLAEQVGEEADRMEGARPTLVVDLDAALDGDAHLLAQQHEVADRAQVDVGRVVPLVGQCFVEWRPEWKEVTRYAEAVVAKGWNVGS